MPDTTPLGPGPSPFPELPFRVVAALIVPMAEAAARAFGGDLALGDGAARNALRALGDGVAGHEAFDVCRGAILTRAAFELTKAHDPAAQEMTALYVSAHHQLAGTQLGELGFRASLILAGMPRRLAMRTARPAWLLPEEEPDPVRYETRVLESSRSGAWARVAAHRGGREVAEVAVFRATTVVSIDGSRLSVTDPDGDHAVDFVEQVVALMEGEPLDGVDLREMLAMGRKALAGEVAA